MALSRFVLCKWASADASHQQALANDCQDAKEKSFSLAGEAYNLAIMVTTTVCLFLCLDAQRNYFTGCLCIYSYLCWDGYLSWEHNEQYSTIINIYNDANQNENQVHLPLF